jgi:hypothetical protein
MNEHPPITPEQRERMKDDFSDAAVVRRAAAMVEQHGEEIALERAGEYRDMHEASSPAAAFWSRVRARILAPPAEAACAEPSEVKPLAGPSPALRCADPTAPSDGSVEPAPRWRGDPDCPKPATNRDPDQGELF